MNTKTGKPSTLKRMLIMIGLVILVIAALAFGKFLQIKKLIASAPKPAPQIVTAVKVESLQWNPQVPAVGTMVAVRGIDVTSEVAGLVRQVNFKSGDEVQKGKVLVQLNADSDLAQLRSLQAQADLAATVLKRDRQQLAARAISQAQVDSDSADLAAKQALVAQQAALVEKKTIVASFSGKLGISTANPGQYINPGDKIVPLQTLDPIYVDFHLPQQQLAQIAVGQPVNLQNDAFPGQTFSGKISAISPQVDTTTRNVTIEATVENPKHQLLPGMFSNVNVDIGEKKDYLTLPQTAITYNPYGSTVFVLKTAGEVAKEAQAAASGASAAAAPASAASAPAGDPSQLVAQQVFVTPGPTRGDQVAILKGLEAGQQVVTSGQLKLKNGTPVTIDNTLQPLDDVNPKPQEH